MGHCFVCMINPFSRSRSLSIVPARTWDIVVMLGELGSGMITATHVFCTKFWSDGEIFRQFKARSPIDVWLLDSLFPCGLNQSINSDTTRFRGLGVIDAEPGIGGDWVGQERSFHAEDCWITWIFLWLVYSFNSWAHDSIWLLVCYLVRSQVSHNVSFWVTYMLRGMPISIGRRLASWLRVCWPCPLSLIAQYNVLRVNIFSPHYWALAVGL